MNQPVTCDEALRLADQVAIEHLDRMWPSWYTKYQDGSFAHVVLMDLAQTVRTASDQNPYREIVRKMKFRALALMRETMHHMGQAALAARPKIEYIGPSPDDFLKVQYCVHVTEYEQRYGQWFVRIVGPFDTEEAREEWIEENGSVGCVPFTMEAP